MVNQNGWSIVYVVPVNFIVPAKLVGTKLRPGKPGDGFSTVLCGNACITQSNGYSYLQIISLKQPWFKHGRNNFAPEFNMTDWNKRIRTLSTTFNFKLLPYTVINYHI